MKLVRRTILTTLLLLVTAAVYAGSIKSAADFVAFATAINKGESIAEWRNDQGRVPRGRYRYGEGQEIPANKELWRSA